MPMSLRLAHSDTGLRGQSGLFHSNIALSDNIVQAPGSLNHHLRVLHQFSTQQHFARNETIFSEGERADRFYKIISGTVRLCRHSPDGKRHIADFYLPGDLVGFVEFSAHPYSAEAVTEATLCSYPRNQLERLSATDPEIRLRVLSHLSASLLAAQQHLFVLSCRNAKERFAEFLLRLAERTDVGRGDRLDLAMGRQDIADHLGLTIESVCRAIATLKSDGLVTVPNTHQLILNDIEKLRALANGSDEAAGHFRPTG